MRFAGYACFLVRDVVWCQSDANSVQNRLTKIRSVQFACLIRPTVSSFSSVRGTAAKSLRSVHSAEFANSSGPDRSSSLTGCHTYVSGEKSDGIKGSRFLEDFMNDVNGDFQGEENAGRRSPRQ